MQEEIWGEDHDTWIASPYAPMGILRPVDGGYVFNGRWQFSSGTDHCDWIFLGAFMGDAEGNRPMPPQNYHVILPRSDYEIVEDSWDVVGLRGTGSKDIIVKDAFIPENRAIAFSKFLDGSQPREAGLTNPTYHIPFTTRLPARHHQRRDRHRRGRARRAPGLPAHPRPDHRHPRSTTTRTCSTRSARRPRRSRRRAPRCSTTSRASTTPPRRDARSTFAERAASRRTQVAAAWRAVRAMDEIVARSGGNGLRMDNPIQRFWRDGHMGLAHAIHVPGSVFHVVGADRPRRRAAARPDALDDLRSTYMTDIRGLGYLRVQTTDVARWRELTVEALGLAEATGPEADGLYLRMDERQARLIVLPGDDRPGARGRLGGARPVRAGQRRPRRRGRRASGSRS